MAGELLQEGDVLKNKYRVERVLGEGGMGVVVAAHHLHLDQRVAIKVLWPEMLRNPEVVARFAREARLAIKIKSEHVARVMDVDTLASGEPMMVMEYLEGCDLAAHIRDQGAMPVQQVISFVLQACEAIAEAHTLGIIHRDLKPSNLFLSKGADGEPFIKVLDFGIARLSSGGPEQNFNLTSTRAIIGSPLYMSPEQMSSARSVDVRTDIWALGAILHEALTGSPPFHGETITQLVASIITNRPREIRETRSDAPEGLEQAIRKCLEKERDRRWNNVAELAAVLANYGPKSAWESAEKIMRVMQAAGMATVSLPGEDARRSIVDGEEASRSNAATAQTIQAERTDTAASEEPVDLPIRSSRTAVLLALGGGVAVLLIVVAALVLRSGGHAHASASDGLGVTAPAAEVVPPLAEAVEDRPAMVVVEAPPPSASHVETAAPTAMPKAAPAAKKKTPPVTTALQPSQPAATTKPAENGLDVFGERK